MILPNAKNQFSKLIFQFLHHRDSFTSRVAWTWYKANCCWLWVRCLYCFSSETINMFVITIISLISYILLLPIGCPVFNNTCHDLTWMKLQAAMPVWSLTINSFRHRGVHCRKRKGSFHSFTTDGVSLLRLHDCGARTTNILFLVLTKWMLQDCGKWHILNILITNTT